VFHRPCPRSRPLSFNAEGAKILEGVTSVPKAGSPGPIGIWGNIAFPILFAAAAKSEAAKFGEWMAKGMK